MRLMHYPIYVTQQDFLSANACIIVCAVQQVAANFGDLFLSGEGIFGLRQQNISSRKVRNLSKGPAVDPALSFPDSEVQVMCTSIHGSVFGGLFRTW